MVENLASLFRPALARAFEQALAHLTSLPSAPVAPTADLATVRSRLNRVLTDEGLPAEQVIAELARDVEGSLVGCGSGRFFAWVIGGRPLAFLMYPQAETAEGRLDSLDPDTFRYEIRAKEIPANA